LHAENIASSDVTKSYFAAEASRIFKLSVPYFVVHRIILQVVCKVMFLSFYRGCLLTTLMSSSVY